MLDYFYYCMNTFILDSVKQYSFKTPFKKHKTIDIAIDMYIHSLKMLVHRTGNYLIKRMHVLPHIQLDRTIFKLLCSISILEKVYCNFDDFYESLHLDA